MIKLRANSARLEGEVSLPGSKSESNRALIIKALTDAEVQIENLSTARDTEIMVRLLEADSNVLDAADAGTVMRFLTAYLALRGKDHILTGSPRMCDRPIGVLVDALNELGANIAYWQREGYPPLKFNRLEKPIHGGSVDISGEISSQFLTALMLIGPVLEGGLTLNLQGKVSSRPYLEMTAQMIEHFGGKVDWSNKKIKVHQRAYQAASYTVEPDWSSASYWYAFMALAGEDSKIFLPGLKKESLQGDRAITSMMDHFGVRSKFTKSGVTLTRKRPKTSRGTLELDFSHQPDLAQTVAVVAAATGRPLLMTGLDSLRIKETDRIQALQTELARFGVEMIEKKDGFLVEGEWHSATEPIETYDDHRMAMAFAPLVMRQPGLEIRDESVVEKSYPSFWEDLGRMGITIER